MMATSQGNAKDGLAHLMSSEVSKAEGKIRKAIVDDYINTQNEKKDYRKYKLSAASKLAAKVASISLNTAKLVGPTGANVLAWQSLVKDLVKTYNLVKTLATDAESLKAKIDNSLPSVLDWHSKLGDGHAATVSEVGLELLKLIVGTDCGNMLDAVSADVKTYNQKITGVDQKLDKIAKELMQVLHAMDKPKGKLPSDISAAIWPPWRPMSTT